MLYTGIHVALIAAVANKKQVEFRLDPAPVSVPAKFAAAPAVALLQWGKRGPLSLRLKSRIAC